MRPVSNDELRTVRDAMPELNWMVHLLERGESEKFVLTKNGNWSSLRPCCATAVRTGSEVHRSTRLLTSPSRCSTRRIGCCQPNNEAARRDRAELSASFGVFRT